MVAIFLGWGSGWDSWQHRKGAGVPEYPSMERLGWTHADLRQLIKLAFHYLSPYFLYNVATTVFTAWSAKSFVLFCFVSLINYVQDDMTQCRKTRKHE